MSYRNEDWHWGEGYLAALCDALRAEGAPMEDWVQVKNVAFDVQRGEPRAPAGLTEPRRPLVGWQ